MLSILVFISEVYLSLVPLYLCLFSLSVCLFVCLSYYASTRKSIYQLAAGTEGRKKAKLFYKLRLERGWGGEKERQRDRQTDRQTDRHTYIYRERERDRERQIGKYRYKYKYKQREREREIERRKE